jgi:hypothetical protein
MTENTINIVAKGTTRMTDATSRAAKACACAACADNGAVEAIWCQSDRNIYRADRLCMHTARLSLMCFVCHCLHYV